MRTARDRGHVIEAPVGDLRRALVLLTIVCEGHSGTLPARAAKSALRARLRRHGRLGRLDSAETITLRLLGTEAAALSDALASPAGWGTAPDLERELAWLTVQRVGSRRVRAA